MMSEDEGAMKSKNQYNNRGHEEGALVKALAEIESRDCLAAQVY